MTIEQDHKAAAEPPLDCLVMRRVVCAAILVQSHIICSARHYDRVMWAQISAVNWIFGDVRAVQGFIDQHGEFLNREDAWKVAEDAGQIIRRVGGDGRRLFSENLY